MSIPTPRASRDTSPAATTAATADPAAPLKRVALLIETSGAYGRDLLRGIANYNRQHGRWSAYFRPHGLGAPPPQWLPTWEGDGILVRVDSRAVADAIVATGLPCVNLRSTALELPYPFVTVDNAQVGQLAAQHLIERGLRHFAFVNKPPGANPELDQRGAAFHRAIHQHAGSFDTFIMSPESLGWEQAQERLANWVRGLPKPMGIFACNDRYGVYVIDACRRANAHVPDAVAVIGADNDDALCDLGIPPLSSIDVNAEGVGYEAARILDGMMNGKEPESSIVEVPPRGVITRRSTDVIASEDQEVNQAIRFIRENACRGVQVIDVLEHLGMSRATLQQRIKEVTGRTIHQEIQRVRLNRCKELLAMSNLTIKQAARQSGFSSVQYMTRVFRSATGETPAKYRTSRTQ
jgi:LacI family transcriptional regulator